MSDGITEQPPAEDDLDRALRELTEGTAGEAAFKELSAAERAKAAKKQPRQARKAAKARAAAAPEPSAGWRGSYRYDLPARELRKQGRRARRRRALKVTAWTAAAVVLAGAGVFAYQHFSQAPGSANDVRVATNGALPASSGALSPLSAADDGPPSDPFAGTPAENWANGAAGIVVPKATITGPFTLSQVASAYQTARQLLIAQNLDHTTLLGGAPTAFEKLLTSSQRSQFVAGLDKTGTDSHGNELSTRAWLASFAPGTVLIGSVIKVHGTMSARAGTYEGQPVLDIEVNYRFVYPVEPAHAPQDWMRVVGELTGMVQFGDWDNNQVWLPVMLTSDSQAGVRCDINDGYIHPEFPNGSPDRVQPSGTPVDPYSMQDNSANGNACQATTGT
jgi:hypothetical protein